MTKYKFRAILAAAALSVVMLLLLSNWSGGFLLRRKASPDKNEEQFRSLLIEKFGEKVRAPDFALEDLQGNQVALRDHRGKVVFLNFWATWCPPCRTEMPSMERLYRKLKGEGLVMLAVDMQENQKQVAKFMKGLDLSFPALLDGDGSVSYQYNIIGLPSTYIIDPQGYLVGKAVGPRDWSNGESVNFFQSLLLKKQPLDSQVPRGLGGRK